MVQAAHQLPRVRRCELLGISRSSSYYQPQPVAKEDLALMQLIDRIHMGKPFLRSRWIVDALTEQSYDASRKHVQCLMRLMGIQAIHPGPKTSKPHPQHKKYPYLLRELEINRANQVWCSDVTYLPMASGFLYLTVIMDWYSRRALSWRVSNSLEASFCVDALEEAIYRYGKPTIFNTDQGSQYTSEVFTDVLKDHGIEISMGGKGAWKDNVFVEPLKGRLICRKITPKVPVQKMGSTSQYISMFYNSHRLHSYLGYKSPNQHEVETKKLLNWIIRFYLTWSYIKNNNS